jgi:hypothetical protein
LNILIVVFVLSSVFGYQHTALSFSSYSKLSFGIISFIFQ